MPSQEESTSRSLSKTERIYSRFFALISGFLVIIQIFSLTNLRQLLGMNCCLISLSTGSLRKKSRNLFLRIRTLETFCLSNSVRQVGFPLVTNKITDSFNFCLFVALQVSQKRLVKLFLDQMFQNMARVACCIDYNQSVRDAWRSPY